MFHYLTLMAKQITYSSDSDKMLILEEILKWHLEAFASEREKEEGGYCYLSFLNNI